MRALLDVIKDYTTNENNVVGPSTSNLRTVTAHNDANTIYIDPNGNDSNSGVRASPVKTLDVAIGKLTGAFVIITAIDDIGGPNSMVFAAPDVTIPAGTTIQVVEGETATIKRNNLIITDSSSLSKPWRSVTYYTGTNTFWACAPNDFIYKSTDGINWTIVNPAPINVAIFWRDIFANESTIAAVEGTDNVFYSVDSGTTWLSTALSKNPTSIYYANGIWLITWSESSSDNGIAWSIDLTSWNYVSFDLIPNSVPEDITYGNGIWLVATSNVIHYSTDGINWKLSSSLGIGWEMVAFGNGIFIAGQNEATNSYIYYSTDGINWLQSNSPSARWRNAYYSDGKFIAVNGDGGDLKAPYYSFDGIDWFIVDGAPLFLRDIVGYKGTWIMATQVTSVIKVIQDTVISINNNTMELNGFYLDGNNVTANAVIGKNNTSFITKWCEIQNTIRNGIVNFDTPTIANNIIKDLENDGIFDCDGGTYTDNIFLNIEGRGIYLTDGNPTISNNTFVNVTGFAIRLDNALSASTTLSKLIMAYCGGLIQSLNEVLTLEKSIATTLTGLSRVNIDSDTKLGIAPMFHNEGLDDYHIWHKEEGFPENSPAKALGGGRDAGAYDVDFTLNSTTITDLTISGKYLQFARNKIKVKPESGFTFKPDYKRSYLANMVRFALTAKEAANEETYLNFEDMSEQDESMLVYPVDTGFFTPSTTGAFRWLDPSDQDGLIQMTADATDVEAIQAFIGDEWAEGWYVLIEQVGDGGSPEVFRDIAFKIAEWNEYGDFEIENLSDHFPGTGMPAVPDGDYDYHIVKAMALWRFEYTGQQTINGIVLDVFQAIDLYQKWRPRQWKGYLLGLDYTNEIGSKSFVYVQDSTEETLYCLNPFSVSLSVTSPLTQYMAVLEAIFMKTEITDVSGNPINPITELGKFGNDFWSTIFSRKQSEHASNTTGQSIVLIESTEYKEELL